MFAYPGPSNHPDVFFLFWSLTQGLSSVSTHIVSAVSSHFWTPHFALKNPLLAKYECCRVLQYKYAIAYFPFPHPQFYSCIQGKVVGSGNHGHLEWEKVWLEMCSSQHAHQCVSNSLIGIWMSWTQIHCRLQMVECWSHGKYRLAWEGISCCHHCCLLWNQLIPDHKLWPKVDVQ